MWYLMTTNRFPHMYFTKYSSEHRKYVGRYEQQIHSRSNFVYLQILGIVYEFQWPRQIWRSVWIFSSPWNIEGLITPGINFKNVIITYNFQWTENCNFYRSLECVWMAISTIMIDALTINNLKIKPFRFHLVILPARM